MADILKATSADCDLVRAVLDISLTADSLPNATIVLDVYLGAAEREVKARVADWATLTGDELDALKTAVAYLTGARIAPALPQIVDAKDGQLSRRLQERDMMALAATLRSHADAELQTLVVDDVRPMMFARARGSRGQ
jgi:hypothetical protein